jgi:hypothetical protein
MADQMVPQGTDGVPELIEGVAVDRQSRRYAHTLRRGDQSSPVRVPGASSSLDTLDDQFDIATTTKPKPPRTAEPPPVAESTHRTSAPSESTALYRKRTNPSMPALSPDVLTRATPPAPPPEAAPTTLAMPPDDDPAVDDGVSRLPSVVLDPIGSGAVVYPLALRPPSLGVIVALGVAALIVIGVWLLL